MLVQGKSAPDEAGLKKRVEQGFSSLEIQYIESVELSSVQTIIKSGIKDIRTIHTPLYKGNFGSVDLAVLESKTAAVFDAFNVAHLLAGHFGHDVGVVVHNSLHYEIIKAHSYIFKDILGCMPKDVYLLVENVTPISPWNIMGNGCLPGDCITTVHELRKILGEDKVYMTFDICHMMSTLFFYNTIPVMYRNDDMTWKKALQVCKPYIRNIHLNRALGYGEGKNHGLGFCRQSESEMRVLNSIIEIVNTIPNEFYLTIETLEDDYTTADQQLLTYEAVKSLI